jgi:hypothetical protein
VTRLVLSLLAAAVLLPADFDPARWRWRHRLPVAGSPGLYVVGFDPEAYRTARADFADVRIVRDGAEVPYILDILSGGVDVREFRPQILDIGVVPGAGLQLTLDLGRSLQHNRVRLSTGETPVRQYIRIETADRPGDWVLVRDDGYVLGSGFTVDYPLSTRRYVRVTCPAWKRPEDVKNAWIEWREERPEVLQTVAVLDPRRSEDPQAQATILLLDLGPSPPLYDRMRVETDAPRFYRNVSVDISPDSVEWIPLGAGPITRTPDQPELLTIRLGDRRLRYLRARIQNRDDAPLPNVRVHLQVAARQVRFVPAAGAGQYWLYYGNPEAKQPSYDLVSVLHRRDPPVPPVMVGGQPEANPDYRPPVRPWTDRFPALLYGTLAAAILGLGYLSVRLLWKVNAPNRDR